MNNPSDSLQLDENLARMLAACDQAMEGADPKAPTIGVPHISSSNRSGERLVGALSGSKANVASLGEILPDSSKNGFPSAAEPPAPTPAPGGPTPRIGRFELRRQLGKGGCGIVFLAFDPKLEREVALKIPRPEMLLSQDARRRLIREALAAAEFDHPNLVPVYETGEIGPICFIATAFCPGLTLGEWLDRQAFPIPVRQAARLVTTVAEAVQHAHDRGVLHRDLKPNNVILQATKEDPDQTEPPPGSCYLRGECFVPRLVDFGLAKLLERGGPSETTTRQILGTPKYMAPEQALAKHDDIGPAADVYALGVILYEMLAGRAPFEGATDVEVLRQAIDGHLVNPRQLRRDVPRDLEAICLKAMDRSPAHRYRTAIDLADDLRRFLEGKPTIARPLKWPGRAGRWLRRNDQAVALIVVTVVTTLLLVLGSWSIYQNQQFRTYHDTTVQKQAEQTRSDQQRGYAQSVRSAFLAWRAGDIRGASEYLDAARKHAATGGEPVDFPHSYLARLIAAERLTIVCPAGAITTLGISPDGSQLATGHADGTIALWESTGGAAIATGTGHESSVTFLRFQAPGEIISADVRGNPKSWVLSGRSLTSARSPMPGPEFAAPPTLLVRHGNTIYSAGAEGVVHAWDTAADAEISVSASFDKPVTALATDAAGGAVAVATAASELIRCEGGRIGASLKTGKHHFSFLRLADSLTGIELRDDGVALWEVMPAIKETKWLPITGRGARITTADLSPDKSFLAIGDTLGQVSVISIFEGGMTSKTGIGAGNPIDRVALADNGRLAAATTPAGIEVWSVGSSTPVATLGVFDPTAMRFLPGSDRLATAGVGGVVRVWSVATTIEEWTLYGHVGRVTAIGASPDGRTLVTGSASGELKLWDLRTGQELMAFQRYCGPVQWIEFAERGRVMVTVGQGRGRAAELIYWKGIKD